MKNLWNGVATFLVTIFALNILLQMIAPYIPMMLVAGFLYLIGLQAYNRYKNW